MKAKFTILVALALVLAVGTQAQGFKHKDGYSKGNAYTAPAMKYGGGKNAFYENRFNDRKMARFHKRELKKERRYARHHNMKKMVEMHLSMK